MTRESSQKQSGGTRMRKKYARLIRIGIMSKCDPVQENGNPDFSRFWEYQLAYCKYSKNDLVLRARGRTGQWYSVRAWETDREKAGVHA
jgi:hypothetical protein